MSSISSHLSFSLNFAPKMREYSKSVRVFLKQKKTKEEMRSKIWRKEKLKPIKGSFSGGNFRGMEKGERK